MKNEIKSVARTLIELTLSCDIHICPRALLGSWPAKYDGGKFIPEAMSWLNNCGLNGNGLIMDSWLKFGIPPMPGIPPNILAKAANFHKFTEKFLKIEITYMSLIEEGKLHQDSQTLSCLTWQQMDLALRRWVPFHSRVRLWWPSLLEIAVVLPVVPVYQLKIN